MKKSEGRISSQYTVTSDIEGGTHSLKYRLVAGKSYPALARHDFVSDPDSKLAAVTGDCFNVDTEFFFEQRRYPSSAGWI